MLAVKDTLTVLGSALTVALSAGLFGSDLLERDLCEGMRRGACVDRPTAGDRWSWDQASARTSREEAEDILDQVRFPKPGLALMEIDNYGNILLPVQADALVTHDGVGEPLITGMDLRGSRCARSVEHAMRATDGPFTVVCLPREYGLYERMNGRPAPSPDEQVTPEE